MNASEDERLEALMDALLELRVNWRAAGGAKRECAAQLEAALGGGRAPSRRVGDVLSGMGVVAGLIQRRRADIIMAISRDVTAALRVTRVILAADAQASGIRDLTPSESNASFAALLDAIEVMFDQAPS